MTTRRRFLRSLVTGAGALFVGDAALEAMATYLRGCDAGSPGGDYSARASRDLVTGEIRVVVVEPTPTNHALWTDNEITITFS